MGFLNNRCARSNMRINNILRSIKKWIHKYRKDCVDRRMLNKYYLRPSPYEKKHRFYKKKWKLQKPYFLSYWKIKVLNAFKGCNILTSSRIRPGEENPFFFNFIIHFSNHIIAHPVIVIASFFSFSLPKQSPVYFLPLNGRGLSLPWVKSKGWGLIFFSDLLFVAAPFKVRKSSVGACPQQKVSLRLVLYSLSLLLITQRYDNCP